MKFDRARNAQEMSQLLDYAACGAIGAGVASIVGVSWLLGFAIVFLALKSWKKEHPFLTFRVQALAILAFCLLSLVGS